LANWIIVGLLLMISNTARGPVDTTPMVTKSPTSNSTRKPTTAQTPSAPTEAVRQQ